jgi:hypothetical protein
LCDWMYALKVVAGIGLLFEQPVIAHLGKFFVQITKSQSQ